MLQASLPSQAVEQTLKPWGFGHILDASIGATSPYRAMEQDGTSGCALW